jgi:zinc protease
MTTPMAVVNTLYDVGARDESENQTGFAHLFEHLMFGGSINIPNFDNPLQNAGGENNAFTNNDITNYYLTLPAQNVETGFWLESDRMLSLAFTPQSLEVQRSVVIEEFKQRYLNQPYGDVWLLLRPLAYHKHPYQWATIGKEIKHIEEATMDDVKAFFKKYYHPGNATMVVAGNLPLEQVKSLSEKWFASIPAQSPVNRNLPVEPAQTEARTLSVERDVPASALYKVFHMPARTDKDYQACDLLSDILSNGRSARLYQVLVKERKLFSEIAAFVMGDRDPGLFVVQGKLADQVKMEDAEAALNEVLTTIRTLDITEKELQKVKNKVESHLVFSEMSLLNKAMNLAYYEWLGDAALVNQEAEAYQRVSVEQLKRVAHTVLAPENSSTLYYHKKN